LHRTGACFINQVPIFCYEEPLQKLNVHIHMRIRLLIFHLINTQLALFLDLSFPDFGPETVYDLRKRQKKQILIVTRARAIVINRSVAVRRVVLKAGSLTTSYQGASSGATHCRRKDVVMSK
ncbi:hypothetical protein FRB91_011576, partial [Serendipita sp. 411]